MVLDWLSDRLPFAYISAAKSKSRSQLSYSEVNTLFVDFFLCTRCYYHLKGFFVLLRRSIGRFRIDMSAAQVLLLALFALILIQY